MSTVDDLNSVPATSPPAGMCVGVLAATGRKPSGHSSSWAPAQAAVKMGPDTLGGVELGGVGGEPDDGQPVRVRREELLHALADVGLEVVPDQDDRGVQLLVRGGQQGGVGLGQAAALPFCGRGGRRAGSTGAAGDPGGR